MQTYRLVAKSVFVCLAAAVVALPRLQAQQPQPPDSTKPPVVLETIEVTAASPAAPPPAEAMGVSVPAAAVQRAPAATPYDLIRRTAGIEVHEQGQGPGWASDVTLRGFTSDHSSDVLLVIDGVPINLPIHGHVEGYADWSILSVPAIRGIQVIPGPASPSYGNFAFGGVVAVQTASDASGTIASTGVSSYGDAGGWVRTGWKKENSGGLVALELRRDQGWRDNSNGLLGNGFVRGWRNFGVVRLDGSVTGYGASWDSPGFLSVTQYNAGLLKPAQDHTDGGDARRFILRTALRAPLSGTTEFEGSVWAQLGRSDVFLNLADDGILAQQEERDRRSALGLQAAVLSFVPSGEVSAGISGRLDVDEYRLYRTVERERTDVLQRTDGRYHEASLWLRYRTPSRRRLQGDLAIRGDILGFASRDLQVEGSDFLRHTTAVLSPKLGARVRLTGGLAVVGSVSRGFRSGIGVVSDPYRPVVTVWSKEVGVQLTGGSAEARVVAFQSDVDNERIQNPVTLDLSNAGQSRRRGVSFDAAWRPMAGARLFVEGTYNDARITGIAGQATSAAALRQAPDGIDKYDGPLLHHDVPLTPGARVPGVARYFGRVGGEGRLWRGVEGRLVSRYSGSFVPIGEPNTETRPYVLFDAGISVPLRALRGTADVDLLNLADTRYPEIRASGFINPGGPRTLRVALRTAFH